MFYKRLEKALKQDLKTDECNLNDIVRYCIKNVDKIDDMSGWEIVENSYICF